MRSALFAGSFNPITLGHLDIIKRASKLYDKLYVGIAHNTKKSNHYFSPPEVMQLLQQVLGNITNVEVVIIDGLVIDFAQNYQIEVLVRGLRLLSDVSIEYQMAMLNRQISGLETLFLFGDPHYSQLSSSLIQELASKGQRLNGMVPEEIEEVVFLRLMG